MTRYRFDQIAENSTAKKKPEDSDRERYVGLEHLDPGTLEVTRWGAEVTPKGDKLLMERGDVLFGRRRAYQKKVGIAPFDGIFSAHGMVLRPRTDVVDPDFFPFFISSDVFLDEAIRVSVGSLSPTANWKTSGSWSSACRRWISNASLPASSLRPSSSRGVTAACLPPATTSSNHNLSRCSISLAFR